MYLCAKLFHLKENCIYIKITDKIHYHQPTTQPDSILSLLSMYRLMIDDKYPSPVSYACISSRSDHQGRGWGQVSGQLPVLGRQQGRGQGQRGQRQDQGDRREEREYS